MILQNYLRPLVVVHSNAERAEDEAREKRWGLRGVRPQPQAITTKPRAARVRQTPVDHLSATGCHSSSGARCLKCHAAVRRAISVSDADITSRTTRQKRPGLLMGVQLRKGLRAGRDAVMPQSRTCGSARREVMTSLWLSSYVACEAAARLERYIHAALVQAANNLVPKVLAVMALEARKV